MDPKQALADRLKQANNILVTVSNNPSVDQLASCIGLTLALNKLNKHATAVFSGEVPSTIEFLEPDKTIEKNTDSLRDFIISLDKSKADKLRYKVEDKVVKIFITPYRTSISDKDLEFSQGDFNVDAVVAIGVHNQAELDQAITAHGRILHDATLTTINVKPGGEFGTINWLETRASSLSELITELVTDLGTELLDAQMSTALLTGIVSETKRFSNDRTSPMTMTISAELMSAGANQQLVATKLEPPKPVAPPPPPPQPVVMQQPPQAVQGEAPIKTLPTAQSEASSDGTLEISHNTDLSTLEDHEEPKEPELAQINIDEQGSLQNLRDMQRGQHGTGNTDPTKHMETQHMILEPPSLGGQLTASGVPDEDEEKPAGDPLNPNGGAGNSSGLLQRSAPLAPPASAPSLPFMNDNGQSAPATTLPAPQPQASTPVTSPYDTPGALAPSQPVVVTPTVTPPAPQPPIPAPTPDTITPPPTQTLSEIEQNVHSPHAALDALAPAQAVPDMTISAASAPLAGVPDVNSARDAVMQAIAAQPGQPGPIQALNAQPLGDPLRDPQGGNSGDTTAPPQVPPPMIPPQPQ
ncbi:MAG TPA: hypothetical protein VLH86_01060 [Patescibacteria group bacterium]|nr:hypothetical protein [Patescibacteria group bacterium]